MPVTYDDVGYFNDALVRLEALYRSGGRAFLSTFWINPPHAPLLTLQTLFAFAVAGPRPWAADASNVIPLTLLLRLFLEYGSRRLPLGICATLAASLLAYPLFALLVLEFRPDAMCALLTAAGGLITVTDTSWMKGERRTLGIIGALLAGALLTKPTLAPVTIAVYGTAVTAAIGLHSHNKADALRAVRLVLVVGGICAFSVLPYYVLVFERLYNYIVVNAFGGNASIWANNALTQSPWTYYLTGPGGHAAVGDQWLTLALLLVLVSAATWLRHWRTTVAVLAVCLVAYTSVTVPSMKSPFLGLVVPALIVSIVALLAIVVLSKLPIPLTATAAAMLVAFSALTWRPASLLLWNFSATAMQVQHFQRIYEQTVAAVGAIPDLGRKRLYLPVIAQYLNAENIEFGLRQRNLGTPASVSTPYFEADMETQRRELANADIVVVFSNDSTLPLPWPASVKIRKEINQAVEHAGLTTVATIDGGPYLGSVQVLNKK